MGYTHYFELKETLEPEAIKYLVNKAKRLEILHYDVIDVDSKEDSIMFNGYGDDAHETFYFDESKGFNFCKTAYKPYDGVVVACLIMLKQALGNGIKISSDGNASDWAEGIAIYNHAYGKSLAIETLEPELILIEGGE